MKLLICLLLAVNASAQDGVATYEKHCAACHSGFGLQPGQTDPQKDASVLRFLLSQDGWIYPGDADAGRLHARLRGKGAEKIMPPDGMELMAKEPGYKQLLDSVDQFAERIVPGQRIAMLLPRLAAFAVTVAMTCWRCRDASALMDRRQCVHIAFGCLLSGEQRKTSARREYFAF